MQHLSSAELHRLEQQSRGFTNKHVRFISDALDCLRRGGGPLDALSLMKEMQGSTYAGRGEEAIALHEVGAWLERHLLDERHPIPPERLALRLAWLRRLSRIADASGSSQQRGKPPPQTTSGPRRDVFKKHALRFGESLDELRKRYETFKAARPTATLRPAPPPEDPRAEAQKQREGLISRLQPGDTNNMLARIFSMTEPGEVVAVVKQCEAKLGKKVINTAIKDKRSWIQPLVEARERHGKGS